MLSREGIPLIMSSIMLAYSLLRLIITMFKKWKQSICKYWSRFGFRLMFFVYSILYVLTTIPSLSSIIIIGYIFRCILPISLGFLVISIQDFVCYSNRDPTFIKRQWIWLDIPFIVGMIECQVLYYQSNTFLDTVVAIATRIAYEVLLDLFIILLIIAPSLFFLNEIRRNDFSGSLQCKILLAFIFFVLDVISLLVCFAFEVRMIIEKSSSTQRVSILLMKSFRDPVMIMVCFTQDMVDWMLQWIYLDEDAILKQDEGVKNHSPDEVLEIELVGADI